MLRVTAAHQLGQMLLAHWQFWNECLNDWLASTTLLNVADGDTGGMQLPGHGMWSTSK
jgi:hypothetical protein